MGTFEIVENHKTAAPTGQTAIGNLWGKDSHKDFIAAGALAGKKAATDKMPINDSDLACNSCNKKDGRADDKKDTPQDDRADSRVEPQLKLEAPENVEKDSYCGDTRVPKTVWLFLDTSGSMNDHIAGPDSETKIAAITKAFQQYLPQIPAGVQVGLAMLGTDGNGPSFKVLVEPNENSRGEIVTAMRHIVPDGGTPIAYGFQKMKEYCYQANGTPKYTEPLLIIYGGDGGENQIKKGEKDACDVIKDWLAQDPGIATKAIGIAIEKNPPGEIEEAQKLFDCIDSSKSANAHVKNTHSVDDIVQELMAVPGTLPISNPNVDQKVHAKLLEKNNVNGKLQDGNGNSSNANGKLLPTNNTSTDNQRVYGQMIKAEPNAINTTTPNNVTPNTVPLESAPASQGDR